MTKKIILTKYEDKKINLETGEVKQKSMTEILTPKFQALGLKAEEVKQQVLTCLVKNPELEKADKTSLMLAVANVMTAKLSIDPMDAHVALIPYAQGLGKSIVQFQIMWKGYRDFLITNAKGIVNVGGYEIKDGDIKEWDIVKGEIILNEDFWNKDFKYQLERKKKATIGYLGIIFTDKTIYNQLNFACFMDLQEIEQHKKDYGSKTKINAFEYARKTVVKKVIRDNKHMIVWNDTKAKDITNEILKKDQSAQDEAGNTIYVESEGN